MKPTIIKGSEISLIQLRLEDADRLFALTDKNRKYLDEWLPWVKKTKTVKDTKQFIDRSLQEGNKGEIHLGIWWKDLMVGVIGFHSIDTENESSTIGYWLAEPYQGKGIMTNACKMLISHGFETLSLNRVQIECGVGNIRSSNIPKRLGFELEGIARESMRLNDRYLDMEIYGLIKKNWLEKKLDRA